MIKKIKLTIARLFMPKEYKLLHRMTYHNEKEVLEFQTKVLTYWEIHTYARSLNGLSAEEWCDKMWKYIYDKTTHLDDEYKSNKDKQLEQGS